jgi:hypothetical protein
MTEPLIILAPMRSFSTLTGAMLGQHPQMYSLLETHLFTCDTMRQWWAMGRKHNLDHGLVRSIAELLLGRQDEESVQWARLWILRHLHWTTVELFRFLAGLVAPSVLVDKSPLIVSRIEHMQRAHTAFPNARFLHLTRHPVPFGVSFLKFFHSLGIPVATDPQFRWYRDHSNVLTFLAKVPPEQKMRVRGEDLLSDPDHHLTKVAKWLGLRTDADATNRMKHPERSKFARFGPANAFLGGGDSNFFRDPRFRPSKKAIHGLEASLPWRFDGVGFTPEVRKLAQELGYK